MADDTFAADPSRRPLRPSLHFGTIVVVGGGCYGGYYVRQLLRAHRSGAVGWRSLVVVDHDPECAVGRLTLPDRPPGLELVHQGWSDFFAAYLDRAANDADAHANDAIVPSPLMPHLMADWLVDRARRRWPRREIRVVPLHSPVAVPWQRAGEDGTHYVSFADWMCPINCIEPARCPETRGPRSWSMPTAMADYAAGPTVGDVAVGEPLILHCSHRAYGVGMIDVRDVVASDALLAARGDQAASAFLIGTVSHCHGALRRIEVGAQPPARLGEPDDAPGD
jgi:hypothetical protein